MNVEQRCVPSGTPVGLDALLKKSCLDKLRSMLCATLALKLSPSWNAYWDGSSLEDLIIKFILLRYRFEENFSLIARHDVATLKNSLRVQQAEFIFEDCVKTQK